MVVTPTLMFQICHSITSFEIITLDMESSDFIPPKSKFKSAILANLKLNFAWPIFYIEIRLQTSKLSYKFVFESAI